MAMVDTAVHIRRMAVSGVRSSRLLGVARNAVSRAYVHIAAVSDTDRGDKPFDDIPGPRGIYSVPYLGTMLHYKPFTDVHYLDVTGLARKFRDEYGDIMKFRFGKGYCVCVFTPQLCQEVLRVTPKYPKMIQIDIVHKFHERTGAQRGLITLNGAEWARIRKPTQRLTNRPTSLAPYLPKISKVADDYVDKIRKLVLINDIQKSLYQYATESVGMLCFNRRLGCLDGGPVVEELVDNLGVIIDGMEKDIRSVIKPYRYVRSPLYKKFETSVLAIRRITTENMNKLLTEFHHLTKEGKVEEAMENDPNLVFTLLLDKDMDENSVLVIVNDMFFAGVDSTAKTMSLVLQNLAANPKKQERLFEELLSAGLSVGQPLTNEILSSLSYLKACIKESMRLCFPFSGGILKELALDITVGGYKVPNKTLVMMSQAVIVKDPRFYDDPEAFMPERWLRKETSAMADITNSFGFLPFGHGNRSCIGRRFAEREMQIGIAKLVQNFRISLPEGVPEVPFEYKLFACPNPNLKIKFETRK